MAQRTCNGTRETSLCRESAWLRRRRELEDMPMARVNVREETDAQDGVSCSLIQLMEAQNRLLCDILGAVNALTAAQLAAAQRKA